MSDTTEATAETPVKKKKGAAERWTPKLGKRYTPISDVFLENYHSLNISTPEAMFIIQLLTYKWTEDAPWPGFKGLAARMGVSDTAVRGHARSLEKKGLLYREVRRNNTNIFHLGLLFEALERIPDKPKRRLPKRTLSDA